MHAPGDAILAVEEKKKKKPHNKKNPEVKSGALPTSDVSKVCHARNEGQGIDSPVSDQLCEQIGARHIRVVSRATVWTRSLWSNHSK